MSGHAAIAGQVHARALIIAGAPVERLVETHEGTASVTSLHDRTGAATTVARFPDSCDFLGYALVQLDCDGMMRSSIT